METPAPGGVSVVLSTRNRPQHAIACVNAILANPGVLDLVVVDQSDDPATEQALSSIKDARLRFVRSEMRGVTSGRNLGIELSKAEIIAFTDDDCRPAADWVPSLMRIFATDPEAAVVCGRVHVPAWIFQRGFAEQFEPKVREWQGRFPPFGEDWGITANLALRRAVLVRVGQFDPMLGAGAPLRSGGEPDLLFRVLRAGLKVVNAPEVQVEHFGLRAHGKEMSELFRSYGIGTGAAIFKHVRLGDGAAVALYLRFLAANVRRIAACLIREHRPTGTGYLLGFLYGAAASYQFRVDRQRRMYMRR